MSVIFLRYVPTGEGKGWAKGKTSDTDIRVYKNVLKRLGRKPANLTMKNKKHGYKTKKKISEKIKLLWQNKNYRTKMLQKSKSPRKIEQSIKNLPSAERIKELWKTEDYREKVMKNSLKGLMKRPTSLEKRLIEIFEKYNLPFKYMGDGSFLIGWKAPDFISIDGSKICIEVCYKFFKDEDYEIRRIEHFAKYGWICLVFFEDDAENEDLIINEINLIRNGGVLT